MTHPASLVTVLLTALALCAVPGAASAATQIDRLETFRALAGALGPAPSEAQVATLYTLVDEEILDNLQSGGLFASPEFVESGWRPSTPPGGAPASAPSAWAVTTVRAR